MHCCVAVYTNPKDASSVTKLSFTMLPVLYLQAVLGSVLAVSVGVCLLVACMAVLTLCHTKTLLRSVCTRVATMLRPSCKGGAFSGRSCLQWDRKAILPNWSVTTLQNAYSPS